MAAGETGDHKADLQHEPEERGQTGEAAEEAVPHQHAEETGAEETGRKARAETEAARLRGRRPGCRWAVLELRRLRALDRGRPGSERCG